MVGVQTNWPCSETVIPFGPLVRPNTNFCAGKSESLALSKITKGFRTSTV